MKGVFTSTASDTYSCLRDKNQQHIFEECIPLKQNLHLKGGVKVSDIYGG